MYYEISVFIEVFCQLVLVNNSFYLFQEPENFPAFDFFMVH